MTVKSLAILSHKGGVGKTSIAVNLAVYLAKIGKNVLLLDADFSGPSIFTFFKKDSNVKWVNKYFLASEKLENCLQNVTGTLNLSGKLFVGFADPTAAAIRNILQMNQKTSMRMLQKFYHLKDDIRQKPYNVEYAVIDCSPGLSFANVTVMLVCDSNLFIVKLSNADLVGTAQMTAGLYQQLKNRTLVLANLIPADCVEDSNITADVQVLIEKRLEKDIGDKVVEFLGWIPTDLELARIEFMDAISILRGMEASRVIYTLSQPDHPFSKTLVDLIPTLFGETGKEAE